MIQRLSKLKLNFSGFTLVELLVAVAIVVIISAFGIASFIGANRTATVKAQAQELKTLIRKLRTDAGAALKPTNCSSNSGIVYGTYVRFARDTNSITHGISCFDSSGGNWSSTNTVQLKSGLLQGNTLYDPLMIFFSFDGDVKFFNSGTQPTLAQIQGPSPLANNIVYVRVGDGGSYNSGNQQQITINLNGLICDEVVGANTCGQ